MLNLFFIFMRDCIFCKIINGEIPCSKVYEDNEFLAFLDITPINKGHILVIPKKHFVNILDCEEDVLKKIGPILKKLSLAVKKGVNADGIVIGQNNGEYAGQVVMHLHFHIIPRFKEDGLKHWPKSNQEYSTKEMNKFAEEIRNNII